MTEYEPHIEYLESLPAPPSPVVFYGSSSITMWHSLAADLQSARAVNRGFGGSTLAECVYYFDRVIAPLQPASLVLYAGDNDLAHGCKPAAVLASFDQLLAKLPPIPFAVIGIKPSPARWRLKRRIEETNRGFAQALGNRKRSYFIDTTVPMLREGEPDARFFLDDGVHLSPEGYRLWAELIEPYRDALLLGRGSERGVGGAIQQIL